MSAFLQSLLGIVIPLFAVSSMASVGLAHPLREVTRPLRRPVKVAMALLANFVVVPLLGLLLLRVFDLALPQKVGLFLVASAAGAPFLLALVRTARADGALAGGLLMLLLPSTLVFLPLVLPLALPEAHEHVGAVARSLALTLLLPLALGIVARWRFGQRVERLLPVLQKVSTLSLLLLLPASLLANLRAIASLRGTGAIPAAALLVAGALLTGYLAGVPTREWRVVLGLGTGQRNVAAAMTVATSGFDTEEPLVMVVVTSLVGFALLFPAAWALRRLLERHRAPRRPRFSEPETEQLGRRRA
ncbi:transporter [Aggregicoccus sp. 17bor-14]|uniref:bile acid:sodium symporter n=1 Tax=Myxococcaceae TaxID=31 RepID=UPI00129CABBB|nr:MULTISPECIES: bile acid:sodium symporter [Myxococcaceae]MBF5042881.1 bile acid:sodium symporter [Simulacricoccus sp. 17bor-14]MRI88648.1 transporter [Aggregicoccus sp. 17bor-14]